MTKGRSALLVQGMGVGLQLLQELSKRLIEKTGTDEALHFLVKERFSENLDAVVDTIAACDWRIPASELRDLAQKWLEADFDPGDFSKEEVEAWRNVEWIAPLRTLGISFDEYSDESMSGNPVIPKLFRRQLDGQIVSYPIRVTKGRPGDGKLYKEFIVISLRKLKAENPLPGEYLDGSQILSFGVVEAKYIDFDR